MTTYLSLPLWVLILLMLFIVLIKRTTKFKSSGIKKKFPPCPPRLPIIGNLHQLGKWPHKSMCQLSKKYGPVMLLQLGNIPTVVISSAAAAEDVLKTQDLHFCSRPPLTGAGKLSYNFLDIGFAPYNEYWRHIRKICFVELFSIKRAQSFKFIREEEVVSMINSISKSSSLANPVNLTEEIVTMAANVTFRMAFGTNFESTDFSKDRFKGLVDEAEALLGCFSGNDYFKSVGWIIDRISGYDAKLEKIFQEMDSFYEKIIDEHLKFGEKIDKRQEDIVDVLLRIEREQERAGSVKFTKNNIKAVLMDIFLAGVAPITDALIWTLCELVKNPRVMKKAQEEVRNIIGTKERVKESDINDLNYLKMILKETLRLHPAVPLLLPRRAMLNSKINGYDISPGMLIQVNVWAMGRDPNHWNNPEEFLPERFSNSLIDSKGQNFGYLPFGAGRRSCPGQYMGTILLEIALANLLYFFNWKLPNGVDDVNMDVRDGPSINATKREPLILEPVNYL